MQDADKPKEEAPVESEAKCAKGKKPSAAVRAMQQQVEERRRAEEEARAAAEAEKAAKEEAERQAELELQREEEERIRKAEEKKAQREQMRKEGKLLSTKQKAEARKLAAERELRLAKAQVCDELGGIYTPPLLESSVLGTISCSCRGYLFWGYSVRCNGCDECCRSLYHATEW